MNDDLDEHNAAVKLANCIHTATQLGRFRAYLEMAKEGSRSQPTRLERARVEGFESQIETLENELKELLK